VKLARLVAMRPVSISLRFVLMDGKVSASVGWR
jgi:hypothetical protein